MPSQNRCSGTGWSADPTRLQATAPTTASHLRPSRAAVDIGAVVVATAVVGVAVAAADTGVAVAVATAAAVAGVAATAISMAAAIAGRTSGVVTK